MTGSSKQKNSTAKRHRQKGQTTITKTLNKHDIPSPIKKKQRNKSPNKKQAHQARKGRIIQMNILDEDEDDDMDMSNKNVVEDMSKQHKPRLLSDINKECENVQLCGHSKCKTCTVIQYANDKIMSTCTGRTYDIQYDPEKNISAQRLKMIENNKKNAIKRKEKHTRMSEQDKTFEINDFKRKQKSIHEKMKKINHKLDCKSDWIVYLATCACCGAQYVGSTIQELHNRCNTRRNKMINANEQTENEQFTDMIRHYTQENSKCNMESLRIQPVE